MTVQFDSNIRTDKNCQCITSGIKHYQSVENHFSPAGWRIINSGQELVLDLQELAFHGKMQ
jgi:hypothetical protein